MFFFYIEVCILQPKIFCINVRYNDIILLENKTCCFLEIFNNIITIFTDHYAKQSQVPTKINKTIIIFCSL